jgi:toxin ParE1/3/4
MFPERGMLWSETLHPIRVVGYRRRVSIVFAVEQQRVMILGVFYGGQNIDLDLIEERF